MDTKVTHLTTSPSQSVLKMSAMSPADTSREMATPLTDGCNNNFAAFSIRLTVSVSVLQNVINTSLRKEITQASLEMQLQLCPG